MKRSMIESLFSFNLPMPFLKGEIKTNLEKRELDSKIFVKRPDKQILLTAIYKDTEIDSFSQMIQRLFR